MGRMKDRIDFELGDLKFSDHLMQQVLERTCKEEENRQEEKWILMILELLQKESLSGFEILSELKMKSGENDRFKEENLYPLLHMLTEQKLLISERKVRNGIERTVYELTSLGKIEKTIRKGRSEIITEGENFGGLCHGER